MHVEESCYFTDDTLPLIFSQLCSDSADQSFSLNQLRFVSTFFKKIVDENSAKLYLPFAFKYKVAYSEFEWEKKLFDHVIALNKLGQVDKKYMVKYRAAFELTEKLFNTAKTAYDNEKATHDFYSIFSGPLVTFDKIPTRPLSYSEIKRTFNKYSDPRSLLAGNDPELGPFVFGAFSLNATKHHDGETRIFIVSTKLYIEYWPEHDKIMLTDLPTHKEKYTLLKNMLEKGVACDKYGLSYTWKGYRNWIELHSQ